MKAVVAALNKEKALVGAFSVITNLRMEVFEALMATVGVTEQGDILYSTGFVAQHCQCSRHTPLNVKWNLTDILFNISLHLPTSPSMSVFVPSLRGMLLCGFYCLLRPITAVLSAQTGSLNPHKIQTGSSHILWITDKYFQEWTKPWWCLPSSPRHLLFSWTCFLE